VPTEKVVVLAYVFSGFCASFGAVLYTARLEAGRPTLGANLLLDIVGAAVIGGASLSGGKGKVVWTLFGVLFLMLLANSLSLLNVPYFTIYMVKGGVILLAALLDVTRTRILQRNA
jgi:ribose/xylose/arabinose/galactoside ABC-type transport system permease subunit